MKKYSAPLLDGSSHGYVLLILFFVCVISAVLAGGILPRLEKHPKDPQTVSVASATGSADFDRLQLIELQQGEDSDVAPTPDTTCLSSASIFTLVDESSSMKQPVDDPKIQGVKDGLGGLIGNLPESVRMGLYVFSSKAKYDDPRELVPLDLLSANRTTLQTQLAAIDPFGDTLMKDGFVFLKQKMDDARQKYPSSKFYVIVFSDGTPTGSDQNPQEVASQMKLDPLNATIFAISSDSSGDDLMRAIASSPKETYFYGAGTRKQIQEAYDLIGQRICE